MATKKELPRIPMFDQEEKDAALEQLQSGINTFRNAPEGTESVIAFQKLLKRSMGSFIAAIAALTPEPLKSKRELLEALFTDIDGMANEGLKMIGALKEEGQGGFEEPLDCESCPFKMTCPASNALEKLDTKNMMVV